MPAENSTRGRDAQSFYAHLLSQIYINSESDGIFLADDFNARIGSLSDIIDDFDGIPPRHVLDKSVNQHGHDMIEFLNDAKFCVLNGRCSSNQCRDNNWTSISRRGRAVVDYICVPHDQFTQCISFKVLSMQTVVDNCRLHGLLGDRSRLPDHSAIITEFSTLHSHNMGH